ncbi:MAG: hypothetical protein JKY37_18545, partial [Nannocystaceae bacterium]|nr:hypothetical protein [Nannocystaceae bacterium]
SCNDNVHNSSEADVDCGGSDCPQCQPPQMCKENSDCTTDVCDNGECQAPSCYDDIQNGNESGVDCGGGCPSVCLPGPGPCENNAQCESDEFCLEGECMPSDCENGIQDSSETDVDCGGIDCPDCSAGSGCVLEEDCESGVCIEGVCAESTCEDTVQNGDETDTDCGGGTCDACPNGADCDSGDDCISGACDTGTCVAGSCMDMVQNGLETDVDCGGLLCEPCDPLGECIENEDCDSGVCDMMVCADPACTDGVQNGDETDVDCGNSCGVNTCDVGESCDDDTDCVEEVCELTVCSAPDCFDGLQNGLETGVDCGDDVGPGCQLCDDGEGCVSNADCDSGVCDLVTGACQVPACADGVQNGDETDVDCGNMCGPTCVVGEICDDNLDCTTSSCGIGLCLDAACDDSILNGDEGGIDCSGSCPQPCTVTDEDVVNSTTTDFQTSPAIAVAPDGSFWVVVWTSSPVAAASQDGDGAGIFGQMFDNAGLVGAEFQVNSTTAGNQRFADVAAYNDGFVVTWQSDDDQDGDATGIFGQIYDDAGATIGNEFLVNETTDDVQRRPSVAMDGAGNFVACWDGVTVDYDVYCRRFSAAGVALAGEVQINTTDLGDEQLPVVGCENIGNFTVAWQSSNGGDGDGIGIFMRRFNSGGVQVTGETQVNATTDGHQSEPAIGVDPDGDFAITWTAESLDGSGTGVALQLYNENAATQGGEVTVNTTTLGNQQRPTIAFASDGDFWVAWQTPNDGNTTGVFGQRYRANGSTFGAEFIVNVTTDQRQEDPDIGMRLNPDLLGVWSDGDLALTTSDIRIVRYDGEL